MKSPGISQADQLFDNARDSDKVLHLVHRGRHKAGFVCSFLLLDVPPVTKNKVERVQGRSAPHVQSVVAQVEKQWQSPEKCHKLRLCAGMSNHMMRASLMRYLIMMHVGLQSV